MKHLIREGKSVSKALQAQIDKAVKLADKEIGISSERPLTRPPLASTLSPRERAEVLLSSRFATPDSRLPNTPPARSPQSPLPTPGGLPVAPTHAVPPLRRRNPFRRPSIRNESARGWVPVMGLPGTPITSGFIRDLGEYNPKLEGLNGIWTYQEMRRGDGQVAGTLRACKLPILVGALADQADAGYGTG